MFTQSGFNLDDYDEVWFFGYNPGDRPNTDESIKFGDNTPLQDAELKLLAEWMDRGGGVLGTGDHGLLGASLCSRVPRVRTMRKWTRAQGVPPFDWPDLTRHETLQPPITDPYAAEGDTRGQPIEPVYRKTSSTSVPHPLFCAPTGVIKVFPDHMHEGEVVKDDEVDLNLPLEIPGYQGVEYPRALDESVLTVVNVPAINRPTPKVIAHGYTTHDPQNRKRFGLVGVYEGDSAGVGRVVVDSTWHHWLSMNLVGFRNGNRPVYENMQAYFRNVALWLARRQQRAEMLYAATWGAVAGSSPMNLQPGIEFWRVGGLALDVIGRTMSQCTIFDLATVHDFVLNDAFFEPAGRDSSQPWLSVLSMELFNQSVVGGVATAMLEPAFEYRTTRGRGLRHRLNGTELIRRATAGAADGHRAFVEVVERASSRTVGIGGGFAAGFRQLAAPLPPPFHVVPMRVVAEQLHLADPSDPALLEDPLILSIRVRLEETVVCSETLEIPPPEVDPRGAVLSVDLELGQIDVQHGERFIIDVLEGQLHPNQESVEALRATHRLEGDPSSWLGPQRTADTSSWRLRYRIEAP
jgi:hypothetical protein